MSAVSDPQGEKMSADPSFLECHKLLKSMEESDTPSSMPSLAPNGHCSSDDENINKDNNKTEDPVSVEDKKSEDIPSTTEPPKSPEKPDTKLQPTNGINGVRETDPPLSNGSDMKPSNEISIKDSIDKSGGDGDADTGDRQTGGDAKADGNAGTELRKTGGDVEAGNGKTSGDAETSDKKMGADAETDDEKKGDSSTDPCLSDENVLKIDKDSDKTNCDVSVTPSTKITDVKENLSSNLTVAPDKTSAVLSPSSNTATKPPASTVSSFQSTNTALMSPRAENKPGILQANSLSNKPNQKMSELKQQLEAQVNQKQKNTAPSRARSKKNALANIPPAKKLPKEMGPTSTFLCDLGLDLVKEGVYKDLISIQSRKKKANRLTESEEKQLEKLKDNFDTVHEKNKDVRVDYNMKCGKCRFVTESKNVMWLHHESPHTDDRENLSCCHCDFVTRIPVSFTYHMEAEHQMKGRINPKPAFWNCPTCAFETNSKGNLTKHKWKCEKAFDYKTNLCPTSSHVNYCLAYNFYKTPKPEVPKDILVRVPVQRPPIRPTPPREPMMHPSFHSLSNNSAVPRQAGVVFRTNTPSQMRMQMVIQPQRQIGNDARPRYQFVQRPATTVRQMISSQYPRPQTTIVRQPTTMVRAQNTMVRAQNTMLRPQNVMVRQPNTMVRPPNTMLRPPNTMVRQQNTMVRQQNTMVKPQQSLVRPQQPQADLGLVSCEICKGFVKDKDALRVHFYFAHQIDLPSNLLKRAQPPLFCEVCLERFWTSQGLQKHKETNKHFAKTRMHICIICGNHVNHLLTHMSSVHNLSLKDFLIAKRCIVCGGSFQNRPSLEIHLASTHGILVRTSGTPAIQNQAPQQQQQQQQQTPPPKPSQAMVSPQDTRIMHLSILMNKATLSCSICNIPFLNNDLLVKHCQHCHVTCVNCGIVFGDLITKSRHKCSQSYTTWPRSCLVCGTKIISKNMRAHVQLHHIKKELKVSLKRERQAEALADDIVKRRRLDAESVIVLDDDDKEGEEDIQETKDVKEESEQEKPVEMEVKNSETKSVESVDKDSNVAKDNKNTEADNVSIAGNSDTVTELKPKDKDEKCEKENETKVSTDSDKLKECKSDQAANDITKTDPMDTSDQS